MVACNFSPISIEDLLKKIKDVGGHSELVKHLEKDIKVKFNIDIFNDKGGGVLGYHTDQNGLTFYGFTICENKKLPVVVICYWDGSKLRAYLPDTGKDWNGNDELVKQEILCRILAPGMKSLLKPRAAKKPVATRPIKKPSLADVVLQEINEIKLRLDSLAEFVNSNKE